MRLLLVRHSLTPETGTVLTGRLPGVGLSDEGRELAEHLGSRLQDVRVAALYTSPVQRCRETAGILAPYLGAAPTPHREFIEVDFGRWSGRDLAKLRRLKGWAALAVASRFTFPDGESLVAVQSRAVAAVEDLAADHRSRTVAVVTHADVIRLVLAWYLGAPLDMFHRLDVLPASVSVVDLPAGGPPRVAVVNDVPDPGRWR
jgi:probable phosphomutase (TIGR03848 family)